MVWNELNTFLVILNIFWRWGDGNIFCDGNILGWILWWQYKEKLKKIKWKSEEGKNWDGNTFCDGNTLSASRSERLECSLIYQAEPQGQMFFLNKIPSSSFFRSLGARKARRFENIVFLFLNCFYYFYVSFGLVHETKWYNAFL